MKTGEDKKWAEKFILTLSNIEWICPKKMLEKQSADVDTITGATVSTKNWKVAVQRALDQAKK